MAITATGVQTGIDTDLSGLLSITGVTSSEIGRKTVYVVPAGITITVNGTLTGNPEIERVVYNDYTTLFDVSSTGLFNCGTTITTSNGVAFERYSVGVLITQNALPDPQWWTDQGRALIRVRSGGRFHWRGATVIAPIGLYFDDGSSVLWQEGILRSPPIGGLVTANGGNAGRGAITWMFTTDFRFEDARMELGGELLIAASPTGTNGVDSSKANGIFGYSAEATVYALFPNRLGGEAFTFENPTFTFADTELAGSGNFLDVAVQSELGIDGVRQVAKVLMVNEKGGTNIRLIGGENGNDVRNFAVIWVARDINFNVTDLTGSTFTGGRWYIKDTNNNLRKNLNNTNETSDRTYTGTFTDGVSTDARVVLGVLNVPNQANPRNITNDPNTSDANSQLYRLDLRGKVNTLGSDLFDIHTWVYEYEYLPFSNTDLSDGTVGTRIINGAYPADNNITRERTGVDGITALNTSIGTDFVVTADKITTTSTAVTLDDVYDLVKFRKETSEANLQIPSVSTLVLTSDGTEIDMGSNTITQGSGQWSVGTTHTKFKIATNISLNKFVLGGGIELSGVQFATVPSSFDNCTLTNSSTTATTGGKTLGSDVVIDGDWDYSTGGNSFNHTQTGDITTGAGDNTYGTDFELTGKLRPGTGNNTFDSGTDVSNVELVALAGSDVAVFGKVAADFVDPLVILTGGSITFPSFPTRLDVNIGPLGGSGTTLLDGTPDGVPYTLCRDGVIEFSGISNGSNIRLSSAAGDGPRTQVAEIAGNWSLGIVDADTRCTFNAIDVEVVTSSSATQFTLVLPPFDPIFNVAVTEVGDRKCTVGAADVVTINEETNTNVQLTGDFPSDSLSNVLNFNNSADAIIFMEALGLTSSTARQTTSGDIFLRTGTTPQDFTGVELQRLDSQVAIRSGIATYSSGVVTVSLEGSVDIFLSTGYTAEVVFELEECIGNSYADQPMTSNIFGKARDSINYIEAMRRRIVKSGVPIPTGGSFVTEDICRSVADGADIRHGTYLLQDTQVGVQLVDGLRDVDNVRSFSPGTKSERQLRDLNTGIESDGVTHKVRTTSRLVVSSAEIGAATISDLKDWGNDLTNNVKDSDFTSQTTGIPTQL